MNKGDVYPSGDGDLEVVKYISALKVKVKFLSTGYETTSQKGHIIKGSVKDKLKPHIHGVGFIGKGNYKSKVGGKTTEIYVCWVNMLNRCYCPKSQAKRPTYRGCSVSKEWHNFQNFAFWYEYQLKLLNPYIKYQLDKDILLKGNKVYSKYLCNLVPHSINKILTYDKISRGEHPVGVSYSKRDKRFQAQININSKVTYLGSYNSPNEAFLVYKEAKEYNLYKQALICYKNNEISKEVYEALLAWKITGL